MSNVVSHDFGARAEPSNNGGEPPMNDLETRVRNLETDISIIKSNYATKEDVMATRVDISDAKNKIILWVVGAVVFSQLIPSLPAIISAVGELSK